MKINLPKISVFLLVTLLVLVPVLVFGQSGGLVPCGNTGQAACTFVDIFKLIGNVIKFLLFTVAIPLCAVAIVWAGIVLVMNPSSATAKGRVKEILTAAIIGLALALASYMIVDTILTIFTDESIKSLEQKVGTPESIGGNNSQ